MFFKPHLIWNFCRRIYFANAAQYSFLTAAFLSAFAGGVLFKTSSASAQVNLQQSCLHYNQHFISRYFAGRSQYYESDNFFGCLDSSIQMFLTYAVPSHLGYYTPLDITRFMQYMGVRESRAVQLSQAFFYIKQSFIGGSRHTLTVNEINIFRNILFVLNKHFKALHRLVPAALQILDSNRSVSKVRVLKVSSQLRAGLNALGQDLQRLPFYASLPALRHLPQHIQALGFSAHGFQYWTSAVQLLEQWKKIFSPHQVKGVVRGHEWAYLLDSFGSLMEVWLYYKQFLEHQSSVLSAKAVPHTQHVVYKLLSFVEGSFRFRSEIKWKELDALAQKMWFLPAAHTLVFKLAFRSTVCFVLDRLTAKRSCAHRLDFRKSGGLTVNFGDVGFEITADNHLRMSQMGGPGGVVSKAHIQVLKNYVSSWAEAEKTLNAKGHLPSSVFGAPHEWQKRNIHLTSDRRLLFSSPSPAQRQALMSHLNWQAHVMKLVSSAYSTEQPAGPITKSMWHSFVRDWTPVVLAFYPRLQWQKFQPQALSFFTQGDILTAYANGDGVLQQREALELFSLFVSAWRTFFANKDLLSVCEDEAKGRSQRVCLLNLFYQHKEKFLISFPRMREKLFNANWGYYSSEFKNFKDPLNNFFTILMIIYHQENMLEYRDKNKSGSMDLQEINPLVDVFQNVLSGQFPFIYTHRDAFAFTTYLFHYGEVPILQKGSSVSHPLRFADWLIHPQKWEHQQVSRKDLLKVLIYLYYYLP